MIKTGYDQKFENSGNSKKFDLLRKDLKIFD